MTNQPQPNHTVTVHKPDQCDQGYTLFCHTYEPYSEAQGPGQMYLVDMKGQVVHAWQTETAVQLLELLPDGHLLYSTRDRSNLDQAGLYKLRPDSSLAWYYHCRIDHDYHVMVNGHRMIHCVIDCMVPRLGTGLRRNPYIIEIDPDDRLVWAWHGEDHIQELIDLAGLEMPIEFERRLKTEVKERHTWDERLQSLPADDGDRLTQRMIAQRRFDWAHNNTCEVVPVNPTGAQDSRFRQGNILFSYRSLDIIGAIDRESGAIVWAWGPGELDGQHQPTMLDNGNILIYDNGTRRGWSRVLELEPLTGRIVWDYQGDPLSSFYSAAISGAERLPNGNTLICEGGPMRIFEVTPQKEIVWELRSEETGLARHGIYRATRYTADFVAPLL